MLEMFTPERIKPDQGIDPRCLGKFFLNLNLNRSCNKNRHMKADQKAEARADLIQTCFCSLILLTCPHYTVIEGRLFKRRILVFRRSL